MSQMIDRACDLEERHRAAALARWSATQTPRANQSAHECHACGEPIPEARRAAVKGCTHCITCQEKIEKYGKA
ncbi:TraR/DksA C4-type zinc finger protein [Kingella kingae]|uniref:DnaK suppressor protein n=1 Tax=Kingella kingae ATCC 23330 TaxID=887327 RepID=F5S5B9_KINKI|nr:TraR/DksA C4-type zinc finger protein [Kingella kingae]EGK11380.1 DnaK suppressor protein [Kingella kingae ATCC 23330]MDK4528341.1 TraR/DksA C4-type zinc finger protein [Kingella kingae]MDK4534349.1 TraR/DksA C4-type zinc finger protein [Kingella kingae]MDK4540836.1 TraR/DksA C4-type zinc finger protein [Kingella kingae]MDK4542953.1 TraR/DksA C4-type zinc finger protein [Kingella kingae]